MRDFCCVGKVHTHACYSPSDDEYTLITIQSMERGRGGEMTGHVRILRFDTREGGKEKRKYSG